MKLQDCYAVLIAVLFTAAIGTMTFLTIADSPFCLRIDRLGPWGRPLPLTTLVILLLATVSPARKLPRYKWSIAAGLFFSVNGDALLPFGGNYFLMGVFCFLLTHICYLIAFTSDSRLAKRSIPFILGLIFGIAMIAMLWREIPNVLKIPIVIYVGTILCMAAQATSRYLNLRTFAAFCACAGAILFVISDSSLAWNHFRHEFANSKTIVLGTYLSAQWLIALSVTFRK